MIITKTPFRISFAGGRTDVPSYYRKSFGAVVSTTIDKYVYVTLNRRFDNRIRVSYDCTEIVDTVDELNNDIAKACLKATGVTSGVDITTISEIPYGTGLGSSSSFTVGLLNALYHYIGQHRDPMKLADEACAIEIAVLGHPVGKQDQYAAALGGLNFITFHPSGNVTPEPIRMSPEDICALENNLMMFYTGIRRDASKVMDSHSVDQRKKDEILNGMRDQALEIRKLLERDGNTAKMAKIMDVGWRMKREYSRGITNASIDAAYEAAFAAGAKGGRLLGAGGGGFLLLYCEPEKQAAVEESVKLPRLYFRFSRKGTRVVYDSDININEEVYGSRPNPRDY